MVQSAQNPDNNNYDPVYLHSRREALIIIVVWMLGLVWTLGYCAIAGYNVPPEQIRTTLGMPSWVFWGILVPWIVVIVFSIWFGLYYIADEQLVQRQDESNVGDFTRKPQPEPDGAVQ